MPTGVEALLNSLGVSFITLLIAGGSVAVALYRLKKAEESLKDLQEWREVTDKEVTRVSTLIGTLEERLDSHSQYIHRPPRRE